MLLAVACKPNRHLWCQWLISECIRRRFTRRRKRAPFHGSLDSSVPVMTRCCRNVSARQVDKWTRVVIREAIVLAPAAGTFATMFSSRWREIIRMNMKQASGYQAHGRFHEKKSDRQQLKQLLHQYTCNWLHKRRQLDLYPSSLDTIASELRYKYRRFAFIFTISLPYNYRYSCVYFRRQKLSFFIYNKRKNNGCNQIQQGQIMLDCFGASPGFDVQYDFPNRGLLEQGGRKSEDQLPAE